MQSSLLRPQTVALSSMTQLRKEPAVAIVSLQLHSKWAATWALRARFALVGCKTALLFIMIQ